MATPKHKNPCPRGHEIYNFGRPFLGHHYYIPLLSLSDLCLLWQCPSTRNPAQGSWKGHGSWVMKRHNFGRSFLGHHYFILSMSDLIL